jgi:hypothetical protein
MPMARAVAAEGDNPETAVSALLAGLRQAALLLESPMSVPVPVPPLQHDSWRDLGTVGDGEGIGHGRLALAQLRRRPAWPRAPPIG